MLASLALAVAAASIVAPCPGASTVEVDACLDARLSASDTLLNRYYRAAFRRISKQGGSKLARNFIQAERAWIAYRNAECGSVFNYWSGGTIRTSMELNCRIRLTRLRTYVIWSDWLTYPDSTPPLLPRPDLRAVLPDGRR